MPRRPRREFCKKAFTPKKRDHPQNAPPSRQAKKAHQEDDAEYPPFSAQAAHIQSEEQTILLLSEVFVGEVVVGKTPK